MVSCHKVIKLFFLSILNKIKPPQTQNNKKFPPKSILVKPVVLKFALSEQNVFWYVFYYNPFPLTLAGFTLTIMNILLHNNGLLEFQSNKELFLPALEILLFLDQKCIF